MKLWEKFNYCSKKGILFRLFVIIFLIFLAKYYLKQAKKYSYDIINNESDVKIYDLRSKLDQKIYESIECRKSAHIFVTTTLCYHNTTIDALLSFLIKQNGVWEPEILSTLLFI
jgi:hypothetical protein